MYFYTEPICLATLKLIPRLLRMKWHAYEYNSLESDVRPMAQYRLIRTSLHWQSLPSFRLFRCRFPSFAALLRTIGSMRHLRNIYVYNVQWPKVLHAEYDPRICGSSFENIRTVSTQCCTNDMVIAASIFTATATHFPYARRPSPDVDIPSEASAIFDLLLGHTLFPVVPAKLEGSKCTVRRVKHTAGERG